MATNTRQTVRELMLDRYGLGRRGTNTGTSASAITADANFGGHKGGRAVGTGDYVMITSGAGAPADEFSRLSSNFQLTTGVASLDPALTVALADGDTFEVLMSPLVFDAGQGEFSVHDTLDDILANYPFFEKRVVPITSVTDGDMLASGTTDWTAGDGAGGANNPTLAKVAASFPLGLRVLRVTNNATGAGDYAQSVTIPVEENTSYYLEATGMIASTGVAADAGTLVVRDLTNGADISFTNKDINRFEPETLVNNLVTPSGCEQVEIRLTCTAVGDIIDWANVIFRRADSREFTLQDRPVPVGYIGRVLVPAIVGSRHSGPSTKDWATRGEMIEVAGKPVQMGAGLWQVHTESTYGGRSLWYEEFIQQAAFSSDTSTTAIIKDHLAATAAEKVLYPLQGRSDDWRSRYLKAARDATTFGMNLYEQQRSIVQPQRAVFQARV